MTATLPELPLVLHHGADSVDLTPDGRLSVQRNPKTGNLILSANAHAESRTVGSYSTYLSAAMIVHIANTMLTDRERDAIARPKCAGPCAEGNDVRLVHVLAQELGGAWTKGQQFYCADCRETLSALAGAHDHAAPVLPDTDFAEWPEPVEAL